MGDDIAILLSRTSPSGYIVENKDVKFITNCPRYMGEKFVRLPIKSVVGIVKKLPKEILES